MRQPSLRHRTPLSRLHLPKRSRRAVKTSLVAVAGVLAIASVLQFSHVAKADVYDDQINALKSQVSGYQSKAAALAQQANTLQNKIAELQAQQSALQVQINLSQAKHDQLVAQIAQTQQKITATQAVLSSTIADMYVESKTTPLEMVASSGNISDYVNAQQYSDVASQQINDAIGQIKVLKAGLQKQQQDVDQVLADQNSEEAQVASNQQQQQQLLNETQGSEAAYQAQIASGNSQIQSLIQQQIAAELAKQAAYGGTLIMGPGDPNSGGYPSNWRSAAQDSLVDYWNMYNRECVSYAAFKVEQTFGSLSKAATGNPIFSSWGNANSWPYNARAAGYTVDQNPTVHSVAQFNDNVAGHVAWVESVNGSDITVSQFNYSFGGKIPHGVYSTMTVGKTYFNNYIHFN